MTGEELCAKLYQRMTAEQEQYRRWLLGQPPGEILNHASDYAIREAILQMAKEDELPPAQAGTLLKSHTPLADVFKQWRNHQVGYLEGIRDAFERCADVITYKQQQKSQREGR
nr:DUF3848 domain-containing protein [uncultured Dysosmobacter sp.]